MPSSCQCATGAGGQPRFLPITKYSDGVFDCEDMSDECECFGLTLSCAGAQIRGLTHAIQCATGAGGQPRFLPINKYREGVFDCEDKSDEYCCLESEYQCDPSKNGLPSCIDFTAVDDGVINCNDLSDEEERVTKMCEEMIANLTEANVYRCELQQNGPVVAKCIPRTALNDKIFDCPLGDDEANCPGNRCTGNDDPEADCTFVKLTEWNCPGK